MKNKQITTKKKYNIFKHLTLRIKSQADEYIEVFSRKELIKAVQYATYKHIPYYVLGGGSNTTVTQSTYSGLVIVNRYIYREIVSETDEEVNIRVSSGYPMSLLVSEFIEKGWEGFEYHMGLPGTIGGGIYMNSKWMHPIRYVSDCLVEAVLIDRIGNEKKVTKDYFKFSYGYSFLQQTKEILLEIVFRLKKKSIPLLQKRAKQSLIYRKKTQPFGVSTCGCFFKNISKIERKKQMLKLNRQVILSISQD